MCMYDMQLEAAVTFVQGLRLSHFSSRNVAYCTPLPVGDEQTACSWIKREQDPADPTQHDAAACQIHCRWLCQSQSLIPDPQILYGAVFRFTSNCCFPTVFLRDASIVLWRFLGTNASHAFNANWITATFRNSLDEMATPVSGEYYDSACVVGARRRDHNSTGFCSGSVAPTRLQEPDVRRKMFGAVHLSWLWYRPTSTGCIIGLQLPRVHEYRIPHTVANNIQNMCPTLQQLISEHVETEV